MNHDRDAQAIFAVRFLLLVAILSVGVAFLVAGIVKVVAPGQDAGHLAMSIAWPSGAALAFLLRWQLHGRRAR